MCLMGRTHVWEELRAGTTYTVASCVANENQSANTKTSLDRNTQKQGHELMGWQKWLSWAPEAGIQDLLVKSSWWL